MFELNNTGAVYYDPRLRLWIVNRREEIMAVLCDARQFSAIALSAGASITRCPHSGNILPFADALMTSDPPVHSSLRRHFSRSLGKVRMENYQRLTRVELNKIIVKLRIAGRAELIQEVCTPLLIVVMRELLGAASTGMAEVARWMSVFSPGNDDRSREDQGVARDAAGKEIWAAVRAASDADACGLLVELSRAYQLGEIQPAQAIDLCASLLRGSADTLGYLIGNTLLALHSTPGTVAALRGNPQGVEAVLEASLMRDSPLQMTIRQTTQEVELGGVSIPQNERVMLLIGEANRHEAQAQQGTVRKAELAFGAGVHRCPGALLARMMAKQVLTTLLDEFDSLLVDGGSVVWSNQMALLGPERLCVWLNYPPGGG
jgi:cytochrome P450